MGLLCQHFGASPVVVQGWSQELREKFGGDLVSMSSSSHVSGTDTYTAACLSPIAASALSQAPASCRYQQLRLCAL